jgi:hypothetical protein
MLRGLGDRHLACGRDLLFLRWVRLRRVGVIHVEAVQHPLGHGHKKYPHQAQKNQAAENGVSGGEPLGRPHPGKELISPN